MVRWLCAGMAGEGGRGCLDLGVWTEARSTRCSGLKVGIQGCQSRKWGNTEKDVWTDRVGQQNGSPEKEMLIWTYCCRW